MDGSQGNVEGWALVLVVLKLSSTSRDLNFFAYFMNKKCGCLLSCFKIVYGI